MRYSILRPALITAALAAVALAVNAPSASAHGSGQSIPDAKHYLTQIDGVTPTVAGLMAKVDPRGERVEVTNATGNNLTIFGYAHEPYLQITPAGLGGASARSAGSSTRACSAISVRSSWPRRPLSGRRARPATPLVGMTIGSIG